MRTSTSIGGLTLNGTTHLNGAFTPNGPRPGELRSLEAQTLGGTGQVVFGDGTSNSSQNYVRSLAGTLTIGLDLTIRTGTTGGSVTGAWVNQGTIRSELGQRIALDGPGWSNEGTIEALGGTVHVVSGAWTNGGLVRVGSDGDFEIDGDFIPNRQRHDHARAWGHGTLGRTASSRSGAWANLQGSLELTLANGLRAGAERYVRRDALEQRGGKPCDHGAAVRAACPDVPR